MSLADKRSSAVILARVSSKTQEDEGYSLDSQLKLLHSYCDKQGFQVVKVFRIAETASKEQSRKTFHELLGYISKNKIYHLCVEKTDRFTRNFKDAVIIDEWLSGDENRRLHAVKENLQLHKNAKSDVKFMWNIHLSVAKKYTDNLREEAMKGWAEKLAQGWLPAPPPPGYITVTENGKRIHVPDLETKGRVQKLFSLYLEPGHSLSTITKEMELVGLLTKRGKPRVKSAVQAMLDNPFYIGINRFDGKDYPGAQQPIISREIFDAVQFKMHGKNAIRRVKHNTVYKSLIRCADCGTMVTWQLHKGKYYGACKRIGSVCRKSKMLREIDIENQVVNMLSDLVCPSKEIIEWLIQKMRTNSSDEITNVEKMIESIKVQIDRIDRMEDMLYEDKLSGEISRERYEEKKKIFEVQKGELNDKLKSTEDSSTLRVNHAIAVLELSQKAAELYPLKTADQRRMIVSKLFKNMVMEDGVLTVEYTDFTKLIASKVHTTRKLMEVK